MFLPKRTPYGAASTDKGITQMAPNRLTKPKVPIGAFGGVCPDRIKIIAPGTQTNKETADDVPMALCGSTEQAFKIGTVSVPPPIPSITEKQAMQKAIMFWKNCRGKVLKAGLALARNKVLMLFKIITLPNRMASH